MARKSITKGETVKFTSRFREGTYAIKHDAIKKEITVEREHIDYDRMTYKGEAIDFWSRDRYFSKSTLNIVRGFVDGVLSPAIDRFISLKLDDTDLYMSKLNEYKNLRELSGHEYSFRTHSDAWLEMESSSLITMTYTSVPNPIYDAYITCMFHIFKVYQGLGGCYQRLPSPASWVDDDDLAGMGYIINKMTDDSIGRNEIYDAVRGASLLNSLGIDESSLLYPLKLFGVLDEFNEMIESLAGVDIDKDLLFSDVYNGLNNKNDDVFENLRGANKRTWRNYNYTNIGERYIDRIDSMVLVVLDIIENSHGRFYKLLSSVDSERFWVRDNMVKRI